MLLSHENFCEDSPKSLKHAGSSNQFMNNKNGQETNVRSEIAMCADAQGKKGGNTLLPLCLSVCGRQTGPANLLETQWNQD